MKLLLELLNESPQSLLKFRAPLFAYTRFTRSKLIAKSPNMDASAAIPVFINFGALGCLMPTRSRTARNMF